jgi:hypothetical protein
MLPAKCDNKSADAFKQPKSFIPQQTLHFPEEFVRFTTILLAID